MAFADGGEALRGPPAGKRRLWEKNQSKTRVFMVYYRSKRRTSILIIRTPTIKKPSEMALGARLLVFGGIHIAEGRTPPFIGVQSPKKRHPS